jgi:2-desacetyl-2-hydroxyethyl bacteriochlorophyllide A dehydrogenase
VTPAGVVTAPGGAEVRPVAAPAPGPGDALVRIEGCGVCGSNVPVWRGSPYVEYPLEPGAPGHEGWGVVEEVGEGVEGLRPGTRVTGLMYRSFAEYDVAPASQLVPLPRALDGVPFPGEALGCAVNVVRRSGISRGDRVAVVGVGFLGALVTRLAAAAGAEVTAVSRRAFALEVARESGAARAFVPDDAPAETFDVVVEAAGVQATLDLAARLTRERGRLVVAGYHQDGPRQVDMQLWNWRGFDVVNAHEREPAVALEGIRGAVAATLDGRIDPSRLVTHRYPLDRLGDALDAALERPDGFLKAVVEP